MGSKTLSASDPRLAYDCCDALDAMDRPGRPSQMSAALDRILDAPIASAQVPAARDNPRTLYARDAETTFIALGPIQFAGQSGDFSRAYYDLGNLPPYLGFNQYAGEQARRVETIIPPPGYFSSLSYLICGYSFGGSVAYPLAARIRRFQPTAQIKVLTFGAPKAMLAEGVVALNNISVGRWVTPEDPVPSFPPRPEQAPLLYGLLTRAQRDYLNDWLQGLRGLSVSSAGVVTVQDSVPLGPEVAATTLIALLDSRSAINSPAHALENYLARTLSASEPVDPPPQPPRLQRPEPRAYPLPVPATPPPQPSPPPIPQQQLVEQRNVVVAFRAAADNAGLVPVAIPNPYLAIARRIGKIWYLYWMGEFVATCPTKKKARALARHINKFLRIYQGVGQSNSQSFVVALVDYLTTAANPAEPFKPTLRDGGYPPSPLLLS